MKRISKIDTIHLSLSSTLKRKQKVQYIPRSQNSSNHHRKSPIIPRSKIQKKGGRSKETKRNKKKKGGKKNVGRPSGSRIDRNRVAEKRQRPTTASVENDRVRATSAGIRSRRCGCAELCDAILLYTVHNGPYLGRGVTATPCSAARGAAIPPPAQNRCDIRSTYSFISLLSSLLFFLFFFFFFLFVSLSLLSFFCFLIVGLGVEGFNLIGTYWRVIRRVADLFWLQFNSWFLF